MSKTVSSRKPDLCNTEGKRDPDLVNAEIAMKRAALKARDLAKKTGTAVVFMEDNAIKEEIPGRADCDGKK